MGRPHRIDPEHGIHHVYSRGTRRWTLFIDALDCRRFMHRLGVTCERFEVSIHAYCLMGNHFHLVVFCPNGGLSAAMHALKSVYARWHNDRHSFSGPLFEARFGSKLVESEEYLVALIRYIHRNPKAIAPDVPLEAYPWSSHGPFLRNQAQLPAWLDTSYPLSFFSDRRDYRAYVEAAPRGEDPLSREFDSGSAAPIAEWSHPDLSISTIKLTVAAIAAVELSEVRPRMKNGLLGVVVLIASDLGGYSAAELRDACGFGSCNAVYNAKLRTRRTMSTDAVLAAVHDEAVRRLTGA